jgi:hypothetical protein
MCQMCDEYENELVRLGLIEDARKFREERRREHQAAIASVRAKPEAGNKPARPEP